MTSKGRPPVRRAPPEKKALSYEKDRRNAYGENDKSSRKAIPLRKALEQRRVRHETRQSLEIAIKAGEEAVDVAESTARQDIARVGGWKKAPDQPLVDHVARQSKLADLRSGEKARTQTSDR